MKGKSKAAENGGDMPLTDHLKELRNRLIVIVVCVVAAFLVGLNYADRLVTLLTDLGSQFGYVFVTLEPAELLLQYFSVALIVAILVALPVIIYNVWAFMRPGMNGIENRVFGLVIFSGLICFVIGILFAYKVMLPFMLRFLIGISEGTAIESSISVAKYLSFLFTIFIIFGIVFEMPVVTVSLTRLGLLKTSWLVKARKFVIIIIFFVAAFITPPDMVSQVMVALPMLLLYQLSIMICTVLDKRKKTDEDEDAAEE